VEHGTVLIVDDEPDALHLFARICLRRDVIIAFYSQDGQEALDVCECISRRNALDLNHAQFRWFHLLEIRNQMLTSGIIPVVVISARDREGHPVVSGAMCVTASENLGPPTTRRNRSPQYCFFVSGSIGDLAQLEMPIE